MLAARSLLFYLGYGFITLVMSTLFMLTFALLNERGRYLCAVTWCNLVLGWLRISCGIRYRVHGLDNLPDGPVVILSNHQSSWETIYFYKLVFPVSPILKRELLNIPFWGWALRLQRPIAIDRSKPREAIKSLLTQGVDRIQSGNSVIVFPEGTRREVGAPRRFSRGGARLALAASVPIIPIAHNAGHFWPARRLLKYPGEVTVIIGEPIQPEGQTADVLTEQVEQWVARQLQSM